MTLSQIVLAAGLSLSFLGEAIASEAEIQSAREKWMELFSAGDGTAAAEQSFTEDAILLPNDGGVVSGRAAIAAFWQGAFDAGFTDLKLETISINIVGDLAVVSGYYELTVPTQEGGTTQVGGKDMVVFKKGSDGEWRMSSDIWNSGR